MSSSIQPRKQYLESADRYERNFRLAYTPILSKRWRTQDEPPPKLVIELPVNNFPSEDQHVIAPKARWATQARERDEITAIGIRTVPELVDLTTDKMTLTDEDDDRKLPALMDSMIGGVVEFSGDSRMMIAGIDETLPPINLKGTNGETWEAYKGKRDAWMDDNIAMICHVDFRTYLLRAMQVKEITDAIGRGSIVSPTTLLAASDAKEAASNIERIQRAQLPPGMDMPPVCQRGIFPWVDSLMDYFLETLDFQIQHLHQYYDSIKPQLQLQKEEKERERRQAEAVATKYPLRQTSYLIEWIVDEAHLPYASPEDIEKLSMGSGLTAMQVSHWATNVRKRNQQATVSRGKKPAGYLDYAFIAANRDCNAAQEERWRQEMAMPRLDTGGEARGIHLAPKRHIQNIEADGVIADGAVAGVSHLAGLRLTPAKMARGNLRVQVPNPGPSSWSDQRIAKGKGSTLIMSNQTPSTLFLPTDVTSCTRVPPSTKNQTKRPASTNAPILSSKRSCTEGPVSRSALTGTPGMTVVLTGNRKLARPYYQDEQEVGATLHLSICEVVHGNKKILARAQPPCESDTKVPNRPVPPSPGENPAASKPKSLLTTINESNETLLGMLSTPWFDCQHSPEDMSRSSTQD